MKHSYTKPNESLNEFIRTVLIIEGVSPVVSDDLPIFTNGMPMLVCRTDKRSEKHEIVMQLTLYSKSPADILAGDEDTTVIGYFFKPFSQTSLFNVSARTLSKAPCDLNTWNALKYTALNTQLTFATDTSRKIEVLDNLLLGQFIENRGMFEIIRYSTDRIVNDPSKEIIAEILASLKLNERTFQRIFKKYVGVTPTQFRRLNQFQQAFGQLHGKGFDKISDIAYDNGFADQSHFIRSFREFTEITPNDYLKRGLRNKNR